MEHKDLSEKLDSISHNELGISFDEGLIWEKLEKRLTPEVHSFNNKWLIAATLFLGVLFLPLTLLKKESSELVPLFSERMDVDLKPEKAMEILPSSNHVVSQNERAIPNIQFKRIAIELAPIHKSGLVANEKIGMVAKQKATFAKEDVSVIQASLGQTKKEHIKTVNIKTQWQKSFAKSNEEYHALKVKLKETSNK
ncbi:MAG: hypothetical protein AAFY41_00380 [Bacteroidota bacterium]